MSSVTVNGTAYDSYASAAEADAYLAARIGADAWEGLETDPLKGQALVSATRKLVRYLTPLLADNTPDPATDPVPQLLKDATAELAFVLTGDATKQDAQDQGSNIRRVLAGSAEVEYFRNTDYKATILPLTVQELINAYLATVSGLIVTTPPTASGVDPSLAASSFLEEDEFGFNEP